MSKVQVLGIIRHILTFGGGLMVGKGYFDDATMNEIVGAIITIAGAAWSALAPEKSAG